MNLENYVTSLELSKQLYELGVRRESIFYWQKSKTNECFVAEFHPEYECTKLYPAYTSGELGEMLKKVNGYKRFTISKNMLDMYNSEFIYRCMCNPDEPAKMLIYLLKNNLITVEEINK